MGGPERGGALVSRYLNGPGVNGRVARVFKDGNSVQVVWYLTDRTGNTKVLLNREGHVVNEVTAGAYNRQPYMDRYIYAWREVDKLTKVQYVGAGRYDDPDSGRSLTADPSILAKGDTRPRRHHWDGPTDPGGSWYQKLSWSSFASVVLQLSSTSALDVLGTAISDGWNELSGFGRYVTGEAKAAWQAATGTSSARSWGEARALNAMYGSARTAGAADIAANKRAQNARGSWTG